MNIESDIVMEENNRQRIVLITGGTGNQGGATVENLLAGNRVKVRVLTRNAFGAKAKHLGDRGVEIVQGDFDDDASVKAALSGVSAAFSVQQAVYGGVKVEDEERRGKQFADMAKPAGIQHLVYTSVDGAERNSGVPQLESKWRIEEHIRKIGIPATILRPVAFMENFAGSAFARGMFLGMLKTVLGESKRIQLVAMADIGWFAARALENPDKFIGRTIGIAGDELNVHDIAETFRRVTGRGQNPFPVPRFLLKVIPKEVSSMLVWFSEHGFEVDIPALRHEHPELLSFESWLKSRSR